MVDSRWLVTGGAGYVGAHVVRSLLASGREVVVLDDCSTGRPERLPPAVRLLRGSVVDPVFVREALRATAPNGVMHLAGRKSPTESMTDPLRYARDNVGGLISVLDGVLAAGVPRVVFSSSSAVYGSPDSDRVDEDDPKVPVSPYGQSKLYGEQLLAAAAVAHGLGVISLRYFNVAGAATTELADTGTTNLIPMVFAALRSGVAPQVYGIDYPTPDGSCIRDYVDVQDVADAHVRAAAVLERRPVTGVYNVGRGAGSSVLEVLDTVRAVTGQHFRHRAVDRRPGDPTRVVGRVDRIGRELGWSAGRSLSDMVTSAWAATAKDAAATGPARYDLA